MVALLSSVSLCVLSSPLLVVALLSSVCALLSSHPLVCLLSGSSAYVSALLSSPDPLHVCLRFSPLLSGCVCSPLLSSACVSALLSSALPVSSRLLCSRPPYQHQIVPATQTHTDTHTDTDTDTERLFDTQVAADAEEAEVVEAAEEAVAVVEVEAVAGRTTMVVEVCAPSSCTKLMK